VQRQAFKEGSWWSRPCGGREVLSLTLPLVISTGSWSVMLFVDRMFLLWYSADMMAATMPAGVLYWTMICFPIRERPWPPC
jgi:multidrug resistance protein, MATE family